MRIAITYLKINVMNLNTPIWQLTVGEFLELQKQAFPNNEDKPMVQSKDKWLVHGISGIAELFGCSKRYAQKIKSSGMIDKAISQVGRTIIVDANLALELIQKSKVKHR